MPIFLEHQGIVIGIRQVLVKKGSQFPQTSKVTREVQGLTKYWLYLKELQTRKAEPLAPPQDLDYPALADLLREHIENQREYVQMTAAFVVGQARDKQSTQKLGKILGHANAEVRQAARYSLYLIGTDEAAVQHAQECYEAVSHLRHLGEDKMAALLSSDEEAGFYEGDFVKSAARDNRVLTGSHDTTAAPFPNECSRYGWLGWGSWV